ncbi:sidestep IV [Carabus blaptoides fortunei]
MTCWFNHSTPGIELITSSIIFSSSWKLQARAKLPRILPFDGLVCACTRESQKETARLLRGYRDAKVVSSQAAQCVSRAKEEGFNAGFGGAARAECQRRRAFSVVPTVEEFCEQSFPVNQKRSSSRSNVYELAQRIQDIEHGQNDREAYRGRKELGLMMVYSCYWWLPCRLLLAVVLLRMLPQVTPNYAEDDELINELDRPIPMEHVQGVQSKQARFPCDITPRDRDDSVSMVLWFKESDGEPLYSFDQRGRTSSMQAKLWSSPQAFGSRAFFRTGIIPASLLVDDIQLHDEGIYRCRVDFKDSPTRNLKINFTVIVPPERPVIYDGKRRDRSNLLEPYNEGADVNLICEVVGGRPRPRVTWFLENSVIDDSYEVRPDGVVVNHLSFPNVGRQHLNSRLICQASNTNLAPPASKVVILDINLKPTSVTILTKERQVSADKRYEVECRTSGSRPEAVITWWKGSRSIKRIAKNFSEANNQSLSILTFVPVIDDDGKYLTCRAENPWIPDSALEDKWRLNVQYMPVVTLKMGSSLNPEDIKEGDDVYFECNIRANPKTYKLAWFHNGIEIHHNVSAGVILSDHSLVLQTVSRATAGDFTCLAANTEGKGTSNPVKLHVRYVPVCKDDREELYGALKQETVALRCEVDANPAFVTFHWTFNNSGDLTDVPPSRFTNEGTMSRLNYTPVSDMDYGTLACWGVNDVGRQRTPCVFQVVAAGRPFPLLNCTVVNQTSDSLQVDCTESFDGGLPQSFMMEILELPTMRSIMNITATRAPPLFTAEGLEAGASYKVHLYAVNAKGRSDPTIIDSITFKGVAKYTGPSTTMAVSPLLLGLIATAGLLAAVVCLVLAALYRRHYSRPCGPRPEGRTKHVPLEVGRRTSDDHLATSDGALLGPVASVRHNQHMHPVLGTVGISADTQCRGPAVLTEDTDPDIIRNQYERRPIHGFMKVYEPASGQKQRHPHEDDEDENDEVAIGDGYDFRNIAKESHNPNHTTVYHSLQRQRVPKSMVSPTAAGPLALGLPATLSHPGHHKHRPEVVTTSNRIQESCI